MFGSKGKELLLELKRSDGLPPYNDDLVRSSISETSDHYKEMFALFNASSANSDSPDPEKIPKDYKPILTIHDASMERNKRCLMAYHVGRMDRLRGVRWETQILPEAVKRNLSSSEVEYVAR